jgi:MFS family permease
MTLGRFKAGIFCLEGLNAFATAFFFNYLFFYLRNRFGFSNFGNLLFCALNGFIYMFAAYPGGHFGQKRGYFSALRLGCGIMALALAAGSFFHNVIALGVTMSIWTLGLCLTWPTLEALVSEKESPGRLPKLIGIYNVIWAGGAASAYFSGGAIVEKLGWQSIFWIPVLLHILQLLLTFKLAPAWQQVSRMDTHFGNGTPPMPHARNPKAKSFLKLAWLANPFSYIAINAVVPLIPSLSERLQLSPKFAGFFCSIWLFSRMLTFAVLSLWPAWHYNFRWMLGSYMGILFSFTGMLLVNHLWMFILLQLTFGWCIGLIYYSSLYYSMDVGEEKGSHGGIHEAVIGIGIFGGPAIGALSLQLFPAWPQSSVYGVALVLAVGLIGLLSMRLKERRS